MKSTDQNEKTPQASEKKRGPEYRTPEQRTGSEYKPGVHRTGKEYKPVDQQSGSEYSQPDRKTGEEYQNPARKTVEETAPRKTGNLGNLGQNDPAGNSAPFKSPKKEDQAQENDGDITD